MSIKAVQSFFEEFVSQLEVRIKDRDQSFFDKPRKGMEGGQEIVQLSKHQGGREQDASYHGAYSRSVGTVVQL
ncbi:MAG: hypothetical protein ABJL35_03615 [Parasphingorhabdus sp.]|uniref:hypothetical protein n=1 Tax=Parasphingorhabdus sp. TaxID=2709688 RepID=UPI003298EE9D